MRRGVLAALHESALMYRVTMTGIDRQEPTIEFEHFDAATRYAERLLARRCMTSSTARAQITDNIVGIHWSQDCTERLVR
jgi:hypothetical protein